MFQRLKIRPLIVQPTQKSGFPKKLKGTNAYPF